MADKCKCDFRIKTVGDGCRYCNPQQYIDILERQTKEDQATLARARENLPTVIGICERLAHVVNGVGEEGCINITHEADASLRILHRKLTEILEAS